MSDNLPQELIVEILSRLPPKTLVRFCGVCKSWRSLISSHKFISTHIRQHTNSSHNPPRKLFRRFCHNKEHYAVYLDDDSFDLDSESPITFPFDGIALFYFRIVGCCNGLLCLSDDLFAAKNTVILWNPAIRRKLILHLPRPRHYNVIGLGFKGLITTNCVYALGFGFDTRTDDFKVVRLYYLGCHTGYSLPPIVQIYTVKGGAWREVDSSAPSPLHRICIVGHFWSQVFVNGAVHWIALNSLGVGRGVLHSSILSFDMNDEVFGEINLPECLITEPPTNMNVHALGELLSVIRFNRFDWIDTHGSIWVMKEYAVANSWCRLYNIDLGVGVGRALDVRNNGEILLGDNGCEFVSYNPRTEELKLLHTIGSIPSIYVHTYVESLALLVEGDQIFDTDTYVRGDREESLQRHLSHFEGEARDKGRQNYEGFLLLRSG